MNEKKKWLDEAAAAVRAEQLSEGDVREATERVWGRLSTAPAVEKIRSCADVQALCTPGQWEHLSDARRLLVEDHLKECGACRAGSIVAPVWSRPKRQADRAALWSPRLAWVAGLVLAVGVSLPYIWNRWTGTAPGRLTVQSVNGLLLQVGTDQKERALHAGDVVTGGAWVRTAMAGHAFVKLDDGSVVELGERAQVAVRDGWRSTTLQLDHGNIIVQAAHRTSGNLFVQAPDCRVSVTGTVFAVNGGLKGSRVSVIQGEVLVAQSGRERALHPGEQLTTQTGSAPTSVRDEIAWSQNVDQHLALLSELQQLKQQLAQIQMPGLRYQSDLLSRLPADTALVATLPNLSSAMGEAQQILDQRLQQSPVLRQWWQNSGAASRLPQILQQLRNAGQFLGPEIVVAATAGANGQVGQPVLVSTVVKPGLHEYLAAQGMTNGSEMFQQQDNLIVLGGNAATAQQFAGGTGGFAATPFGQRLAQQYTDGVGFLVAADLQRFSSTMNAAKGSLLGNTMENAQYFIAERKDIGGQPQNQAVVAFAGERHGIASWLGAPGPMGGLQFVSPDANVVAAAIVKSPAALLTDLENSSEVGSHGFAAIEQALSLNVRQDIAQPLGTEFVFAFDGPLLPTPAWKLVLEVNDTGRLQQSIRTAVDRWNDQARTSANPRMVQLQEETVNGRTYYGLQTAGGGLAEAHYTFADGYLVAAPTAALVTRALQIHDSGVTLAKADRFTSLLPVDRQLNVSALIYHQLGSVATPLSGLLNGGVNLTPEQQQKVQQLASQAKPSLVYAYGAPDQIQIASVQDFFGLDLKSMLLGGVFSPGGANKPARSSVH